MTDTKTSVVMKEDDATTRELDALGLIVLHGTLYLGSFSRENSDHINRLRRLLQTSCQHLTLSDTLHDLIDE